MARSVVLDEVRLTVRVPTDLPARRVAAVRRVLLSPRFAGRLGAAARAALRTFADRGEVSVRVSR